MTMYNLLEYSQNYFMPSRSLWNYYRDKIDDVDDCASDGQSFKYKTKIVGKTPLRPAQPKRLPQPPSNPDGSQPPGTPRPPQPPVPGLNVEVTIPLKYLSNFWRFLDLPLINCEIELDLSWKKDCAVSEYYNRITGLNSVITITKLYVPVVTLSINDNIKFLENIKQGFKGRVSWNKYISEIKAQTKNNNLDYLIDPTFRNINRLFLLSFQNGDNDPARDSFEKHCTLLVEIKDFNALIDNKLFFDQQVKKKQGTYEKLMEMSRTDDYTTGNL